MLKKKGVFYVKNFGCLIGHRQLPMGSLDRLCFLNIVI